MAEAEILAAYPDLQAGDVQEALQYAADAVREYRSSSGDRCLIDECVVAFARR